VLIGAISVIQIVIKTIFQVLVSMQDNMKKDKRYQFSDSIHFEENFRRANNLSINLP
jgi:hypothetical protein